MKIEEMIIATIIMKNEALNGIKYLHSFCGGGDGIKRREMKVEMEMETLKKIMFFFK